MYYTSLYMYPCNHTCEYGNIHVCMHTNICTYTCVSVCGQMYKDIRLLTYIHTLLYVCTYTCTHRSSHGRKAPVAPTRALTHTRARAHMHKHTHTHTNAGAHTLHHVLCAVCVCLCKNQMLLQNIPKYVHTYTMLLQNTPFDKTLHVSIL